MPSGSQPSLHPLAVGHGLGVEAVGHPRRVDEDGPGLLALGVEDAQRMVLDLGRVVGCEVIRPLAQPGLEHCGVGDPIGRRAHEVEDEPPLLQPECPQVVVAEGDDLDVDIGVGAADGLDADLVVLAQSAGLGSLVAEGGGGVPDLPGRVRMVLDEGPGHRRGALGAQRDVTVALVVEVVHLLGHDVGALADALEDADVLEHRRLDQAVPEPGRRRRRTWPGAPASEPIQEAGRPGALRRAEVGRSGTRSRGYRVVPGAPKSASGRRAGRPRTRASRRDRSRRRRPGGRRPCPAG